MSRDELIKKLNEWIGFEGVYEQFHIKYVSPTGIVLGEISIFEQEPGEWTLGSSTFFCAGYWDQMHDLTRG